MNHAKTATALYWKPLIVLFLYLVSASTLSAAQGKTLQVGWGKDFLLPSIAAKFAQDGDTVEIDAGLYPKDAAVWRQNNLIIRAVKGRAHLKADGAHAEGKGIWVIKGNNVTVENIEFSDATVSDGNGAGIRIEGKNLTIRNCFFHHNQNGVLSGSNPDSDILIEHSEFAHNGAGTGQTHNMYIGAVRSFTLRYSYSHHARIGHNVKSRALRNNILYNRIMDESSGNSSYAIDLSNGGQGFIIGNEIQQGRHTDNSTVISFGAEGLHPSSALYLVNNTIANDRPQGGRFLFVKPGAAPVRLTNNLLVGKGSIEAVGAIQTANLHGSTRDLIRAELFDYRLRAGSDAINTGVDPGKAGDFALSPMEEYVHPLNKKPRKTSGTLDIGAHEFSP